MKRIYSAMAAIAATLVFASCAMIDEPQGPSTPDQDEMIEEGNFDITFNCTVRSEDDDTRTEFHDKTIWWSAGDSINFYQRYIKTAGGSYSNGYAIRTLTAAQESYSATISFTKPAEFPAYYWALYPKASIANSRASFTGETTIYASMIVPAVQNPTLNSFDPAADALVSEYIEADKQQTTFNMRFRRVVALGKMTIKNLPSASEIKSITFKNEEAVLAGTGYYELENAATRHTVSIGTSSYSITMNYTESATANSASGMTAYFTCRAFTLSEGQTFTVTVTTTAGETFTKTVTIPSGREIKFEEGIGTKFNVDMKDADMTSPIILSRYTSGANIPTVNSIKCKISSKATNLSSIKYCAVSKEDYYLIEDLNDYIDENGTAASSGTVSGINEGTAYTLTFNNLSIDTEYAILAKGVDTDGKIHITKISESTDWVKLSLVKRSGTAAGVQIQITAVNVNASSKAWRIVPTSTLEGINPETYYTNTLKPGGMPTDYVNGINAKEGALYATNTSKYHTGSGTATTDMVAGTNYTILVKFQNTRGETKFCTASANAK